MIRQLILLLIFYGGPLDSTETLNLTYSIIQKEKVIGQVNASKTTSGDQLTYTSTSNSTTHAIIAINIISENMVYLENGHIRSAEANISVRGRPYAHSYTQYCSGQCEIVKDGHNVIYIDEPIHYASTMLLFEEPVNVSYSYSEIDGSFHPIKKIGDHAYEKTDLKGKVNKYYYENGILSKAKIDAGLIEFWLVRN